MRCFRHKVVEKIKTQNLCSVTLFFFRKSHRLWDHVEKYGGDWGATNDVTIWRIRLACWISKATCAYAQADAHGPGYPHARTHAIMHTHIPVSNTYCFFTAKMVSWMRLSITLSVHCLFLLNIRFWASHMWASSAVLWVSDKNSVNLIDFAYGAVPSSLVLGHAEFATKYAALRVVHFLNALCC